MVGVWGSSFCKAKLKDIPQHTDRSALPLERVLRGGEHLVRIVVIQQNNYVTSPEMSSKADDDDER